MKRFRLTLIAACILALNGTAWAQSGATDSYIKRTSPRFESFAGSSGNYASLATGLRTGSAITLRGSGETVSFNAPTKPMGYGNVTRSLDLAQRQLAAQGISNPTPSQLQAAMMGGTVTGPNGTVTYTGVLQQRASGMGWGQIAHANSLHPGMGKSASSARLPASSASGVTSAAGGRVAASGRVVGKPASPGAQGREQARISSEARISSAAGGNASLHGSGRGLGNSGGPSNAGGGGMGGGMGGGHGNAGGGGMGGGQGGGRGK